MPPIWITRWWWKCATISRSNTTIPRLTGPRWRGQLRRPTRTSKRLFKRWPYHIRIGTKCSLLRCMVIGTHINWGNTVFIGVRNGSHVAIWGGSPLFKDSGRVQVGRIGVGPSMLWSAQSYRRQASGSYEPQASVPEMGEECFRQEGTSA